MSYALCSRRQKQVIDELMKGPDSGRRITEQIAETLHIATNTAKRYMTQASWKYGIDGKRFHLSVRLVYLRAIELGLIRLVQA